MPIHKERRRFIRHSIHAPIRLEMGREKYPYASEAADLSLGGLSFLWRRRLHKGDIVHLFITVRDKIFEVDGKVSYSVEDRKTGKFKSGVCFIDAPSAFKAKLAEEVLQIMRYRQTLSRKLGRDITEEEAAERWIRQFAATFPPINQ